MAKEKTGTENNGIGYDHTAHIPFMENWTGVSMGASSGRQAYIQSEVNRALKNKLPLLRLIWALDDSMAKDACLQYIRQERSLNTVWLRLAPDVNPDDLPKKDVHGLPFPSEKVGKVLDCYLGPKGSQLENSHKQPHAITAKFTGEKRTKDLKRLRAHPEQTEFEIYYHLEITNEPTPVPLDDAIKIIRDWGYMANPDEEIYTTDTVVPQKRWFVIELPK